jgi:hypothetical protein
MKSLWYTIKEMLNERKVVKKYDFINLLCSMRYTNYIGDKRSADSVYRYMSLLKKAGYITSSHSHYYLIKKIPMNLKVKEAIISRVGFFKKEDFEI